MIDERTGKNLNEIEILSDGLYYIYILQNSAGKVKVGITTNIAQRVQSLSGSNSAGDPIIKCYCSSATYLYTLETTMHLKMSKYRINGTEWFQYENGNVLFSSAVKLLERLMFSNEYKKLNDLRKEMSKRRNYHGKDYSKTVY